MTKGSKVLRTSPERGARFERDSPPADPMKLPEFFEQDRQLVERSLDGLLPAGDSPPPSIHLAMRYSVFAGGKRVRPILCLEAARIFAADISAALPVACAFEFIHTYSLIHDDLPALDNDDLRRGKPTCHKQFTEALAILAGDALLTLAFEVLATAPLEAERRVAVLAEVARAAGTRGMVGGQVADIEAEGKRVAADQLEYIHRSKTAALIRAAVVAGAVCGGADEGDVARLREFGENIGWALQVVDDILDVEETSASLGKTAGKDQAQNKATYPALYGLPRSHEFAEGLAGTALATLDAYGERAANLRALGEFIALRRA
jgi:geranylgeranyl diphosphate synthase, type II